MTHEQGNDTPLPERCEDGTEVLFEALRQSQMSRKPLTSSREMAPDLRQRIGEVPAGQRVLEILTLMDEKLDNFIAEQQAATRKMTELLTELVGKKIN